MLKRTNGSLLPPPSVKMSSSQLVTQNQLRSLEQKDSNVGVSLLYRPDDRVGEDQADLATSPYLIQVGQSLYHVCSESHTYIGPHHRVFLLTGGSDVATVARNVSSVYSDCDNY